MGNSRTRRPGAGLFVSAGASPAMQPVVRRLPAKRCALLVPWPSLARTRLVPGACPRRASVSRGSNWASVSSGPWLVCVCPWLGDAVFLYSIKRPQACKAAPPITDCTAFLVYINFMTPVPSLVVCGKGLSFRSGFPHFQPSFPQLPTEFFTACPPSTFKNYVNLQQYNAYKREERGKALFFVNSF